jgi:peroxiredoxin
MSEQPNLLVVDWSKIPAPDDDGAAAHLLGARVPWIAMRATDDTLVMLATLPGRVVVYGYPLTGQPGVALPDQWDSIPGARGCTPQSCAFRDHHAELARAGALRVYGVSTQESDYQREAAERLHLPFPLLSDVDLAFAKALRLPTVEVGGRTLLKRIALVIDDGVISQVFYPVFPPDANAGDVLAWLQANPTTERGDSEAGDAEPGDANSGRPA